MKLRSLLILFLATVVTVGCAGEPAEDAQPAAPAEPAEPAEPAAAPDDPDAAMADLVAEYVRHYNLGHPEMVADLHTDDGVFLGADGTVAAGRAAMVERLTADMEPSPTLAVEVAEALRFGDVLTGRGSWTIEVTPAGADPVHQSGSWLSVVEQVDGAWKNDLLATNDDAPAPAGAPADPAPGMPPATDATHQALSDLAAEYARHFNLGHASMVADFFTEDGVAMYAESEPAVGREAITAALEARMATGSPQLTIHQTGVRALAGGAFVTTGWVEIEATVDGQTVTRQGNYVTVNEPTDDGSFLIRWALSNLPNPGM